jgi:ElaB/YqjD/DUF883 family membrane-anchored ribosome-binding protein
MATEAEAKSLSELEREAEHSRADLVDTVDKLHSRVSPQAIKEEVKAYAREAGYDLIHNLERRARENPLQTVAVAAGLAYPAWRFLINIPAPILLVGAGLALTQMGGSTRSIGSHERREGRKEDPLSKLSDTVENLKEKAASAAGEAKSAITSGVDALGDRAAAAINDATTSVRNTASDTVAAASDTLLDTYQSGLAAAASAGDQLTETFTQSRDTLAQAIENHPYVMGGVGLLVGALIASALPVTHAENRLFGDTSDEIKNRVRDTASEGLQVATTAAHDVYHETVTRAQEQGLSADVVRQTIKNVGEKVKDVAEQASEALDKKDEPASASAAPRR